MINEELVTSWKIHVAVRHIVPFVLHNKSSLGNYAEQCGEAIHNKFKKTWPNNKRSVGHDNYEKNL